MKNVRCQLSTLSRAASVRSLLVLLLSLVNVCGYARKTDLKKLLLPQDIESICQYSRLLDTTGNAQGDQLYELYYKFNPQGNLLALIHSEELPYCDQLLTIIGHVCSHAPPRKSSEVITHAYTYREGGAETIQVSLGGSRYYYSTLDEEEGDSSKVYYKANDTLIVQLTYADDRLVELQHLLGGQPRYKDVYIYTPRGYLKSVEHYEAGDNGELYLKMTDLYRLFDKYGNPTESVSLLSSGELLNDRSYVYEYDSHGCWTKRTTLVEDKPVELAVREVVYY